MVRPFWFSALQLCMCMWLALGHLQNCFIVSSCSRMEEKEGRGEQGAWGRFCHEIPGLRGSLDWSHSSPRRTWNGDGNLSSFLETMPSNSCLQRDTYAVFHPDILARGGKVEFWECEGGWRELDQCIFFKSQGGGT